MPTRRQIPESRRRSRKGCLPCRKRRRKCDEARPRCANCASRNVTCEYGDWTFVSLGIPPSDDRDESRVDEITHGTPPIDLPSPPVLNEKPSPGLAGPSGLHLSGPTNSPSFAQGYSQTHDTSPWSNVSHPQPWITAPHEVVTPSRWNDPNFPPPDSSSKQAALLRFRYQLVPWIDAGEGKSTFGPKITKLAHDKGILTECILYCARFRDRRSPTLVGTDDDVKARKGILNRLSHEDGFTAEVGRALLALSDLFITPTTRWETLVASYCSYDGHSRLQGQSFQDAEEPLKTLWRMLLKIDLSASVITNKPPSTGLPVPAEFDYRATSETNAYDYCLLTLFKALRLVNYDLVPLISGSQRDQIQTRELLAVNRAEWGNLWTRCLDWFQDRNSAMAPVVEGSEIDATEDEPFPPDVYTSAVALQANLVIHLSALILLARKPRLTQAHGASRILLSRSWHAQKITRMAVWNDFDEQWDPIVAAALLLVSREMTHASQQQAISSCFERIMNATQIPLEEDINALRSYWRYASGQDTPPSDILRPI